MNSRDPVEQALAALKSERRRVGGSKQELEKRLMEQFGTSGTASRFTKYRTLAVALGVILVGGAGFAATDGGSSVLKKLFVFVSIDGEVTELELEAIDGEATWVMENDDGGTTTIKLYELEAPEGEGVQTVDVEIEADGTGDKTVELLIAEKTTKVIEIVGDDLERQTLVVRLLPPETGDAVNVEVQLGEDGIATITLTYEDGTETVLTVDVSDVRVDGRLTVTFDDDDAVRIQNPPAESDE